MRRADRLHAITEELRRVGRAGVTSGRLAERFEVSQRTIKRDIATLQAAGVPIWGEAGPGGGYAIAPSATLPPVNFTPEQAVAITLARSMLPPGTPFAPELASAVAKVETVLSESASATLQDLSRRIWLDPNGGEPAPSPPAARRAVEQALLHNRVVRLPAADAGGDRDVEPILIASTDGMWWVASTQRPSGEVVWDQLEQFATAVLLTETYTPQPVTTAGTPPPAARDLTDQ